MAVSHAVEAEMDQARLEGNGSDLVPASASGARSASSSGAIMPIATDYDVAFQQSEFQPGTLASSHGNSAKHASFRLLSLLQPDLPGEVNASAAAVSKTKH